MSDFLPSPDEMTLTVGNATIGPWQSVAVTRSVETCPNSFVFTASDPFPDNAGEIIAPPGSPCQVNIGKDVVVTGYVDRYDTSIGPRRHDVLIQGRGMCEDLLDCSADLFSAASAAIGGMINASSVLDLAQRLCKSFGITARSAVSDLGPTIPSFQVASGETPYEIIERAARYAGFLVYEDQNGNLVLDRGGTTSMASGFTAPGNIESARAERSLDGRYSSYCMLWHPIAQLSDLSPLVNNRAFANDPSVPRFRPKILVSEQYAPSYDIAQARANWELARARGRSQAISLTCDSWRDSAGKLWQPNSLAVIDAPALKLVGQQWLIGTVTYRKDMSGTHADLVLMPPEAFNPQPNPLVLFDPMLTQPVPTTQTPATPGGNLPSGGP
jgi:prophage tail gpP-like protein